jgi:hypothetical protein
MGVGSPSSVPKKSACQCSRSETVLQGQRAGTGNDYRAKVDREDFVARNRERVSTR